MIIISLAKSFKFTYKKVEIGGVIWIFQLLNLEFIILSSCAYSKALEYMINYDNSIDHIENKYRKYINGLSDDNKKLHKKIDKLIGEIKSLKDKLCSLK